MQLLMLPCGANTLAEKVIYVFGTALAKNHVAGYITASLSPFPDLRDIWNVYGYSCELEKDYRIEVRGAGGRRKRRNQFLEEQDCSWMQQM